MTTHYQHAEAAIASHGRGHRTMDEVHSEGIVHALLALTDTQGVEHANGSLGSVAVEMRIAGGMQKGLGIYVRAFGDVRPGDLLVARHQSKRQTRHYWTNPDTGIREASWMKKNHLAGIVEKYDDKHNLNPWYTMFPPLDATLIKNNTHWNASSGGFDRGEWHQVANFGRTLENYEDFKKLIRISDSGAKFYWVGNSHSQSRIAPQGTTPLGRAIGTGYNSGKYYNSALFDCSIMRPSTGEVLAISNAFRFSAYAEVVPDGTGNYSRPHYGVNDVRVVASFTDIGLS